MAHHLEAIAAREHAIDRLHLRRMCMALEVTLRTSLVDGPTPGRGGDDVAAAVGRSLVALRRDLDDGRIDREAARVRLRRLVALAGAIRGRDHAQSPAADPSRPAGEADEWDYRRDRHREGSHWEQDWIDTVVRPATGWGCTRSGLTALLTSCGMAAMTTVLALLERETGDGPIVVDRSTYHETRHLLATGAQAHRVHEVASDDLAGAAPAAFATASTGSGIVEDGRLVVDASVCSMAADPVRRLLLAPRAADGLRHRTVVVESLTKHAQLGLDRVTAGLLVARDPDACVLDGLREHLGTNIADLTCLQLPAPDLELLGTLLHRVGRNAELVAGRLG